MTARLRRASLELGLLVALLGTIAAFGPRTAAAAECSPFHVRLEPSTWNTSRAADLGRAIGQTFLAEDTLISRITVWRPPNFPTSLGAHLYVTGVGAGTDRPDMGQILLDGPTLLVHDSDPPGQFIEMSFVLDPPLALPGPGLYAFFLRTEFCSPASWYIVANNTNPYPYGLYWITGRVDTGPCRVRPVDSGENNTDLLFDIEFCSTRVTPTHAGTWGRLKVIYR